MKRVMVVSDAQARLHDKRAVSAVIQVAKDLQPEGLHNVGDECDCTSIGRWVRGRSEEHTANLQKDIDSARTIMGAFRAACPDADMIVQRSNHTTTRLENYINTHAPALSTLRGLTWSDLMGYPELGIKLSLQPTPIAPGWVMAHGDEGRSATYSAGTALKLAEAIGESVICGHTHKQGIIHNHKAYSGGVKRHLFGVEVGHLMDMKKASYLKTGGGNWQQGFAILYVDRGRVIPHLVPIINGGFVVEGKQYNVRDYSPIG